MPHNDNYHIKVYLDHEQFLFKLPRFTVSVISICISTLLTIITIQKYY